MFSTGKNNCILVLHFSHFCYYHFAFCPHSIVMFSRISIYYATRNKRFTHKRSPKWKSNWNFLLSAATVSVVVLSTDFPEISPASSSLLITFLRQIFFLVWERTSCRVSSGRFIFDTGFERLEILLLLVTMVLSEAFLLCRSDCWSGSTN